MRPGQLRTATRRAAAEPWVARAGRFGFAVRGVVYLVLAYLVARIASGAMGGGSTNKAATGSGVAQALAAQTGGRVVVFVLGVGLACYACFGVLDAVNNHNAESSTAKRWAGRLQDMWRAAVYAAFSVYSFSTAANGENRSGTSRHVDSKQAHWSARVLSWPAGWLWLGAAGVGLLAGAAYLAVRGVRRSFLDDLRRREMTAPVARLATVTGVAGHLARALLFGIAGWFVAAAAIENDPSNSQGVDGAVRDLANSTAGAALLYAVAVGLAAFAGYSWVEARYRRV